ncbi:hypothetical protein NL108_007470 [Boleophthalmus pectinirostris]|uniref:histone H3.v1-like n=1 Tax=Boleophthalmus pectinirostris TaxID=150288 RepID=UPI00242E7435|nr:histone H3.v1-like [Boleophthalmus pectinirostris]KAJ0059091.1 hypothetical protein NL108_007470 [Boleophthalmus pectinirostris]
MGRRGEHLTFLDHLGAPHDVWFPPVVDVPPDEGDAGVAEVSMPFGFARLFPFWTEEVQGQEEEDDEEEVGVGWRAEEEEDWSEDKEEDWSEEEEEDWSEEEEENSGYITFSEEDSDEDTDVEAEEDDQVFPPEEFWAGWRQRAPPAQAVEVVGHRAESPSPPSSGIFEEERRPSSLAAVPPAPSCSPAACLPPVGPALDVLPLGGSKRHRDEGEDEEGDPSSKRLRLSSSEDRSQGPAPSSSSGTTLSLPWYFRPLLQDPESDDD